MEVPKSADRLGRLVERFPALFVRLGAWESSWAQDSLDGIVIRKPVFVCGLARAGTTILLELLSEHVDAASHRYRDFPLVFTPIWWNWFIDQMPAAPAAPVERAHGDRILVTRESPEAIEEPVWMHFFKDLHDPLVDNRLTDTTANPAFERFYRRHIQKILFIRGGGRYLAKGNYALTRLGYLLRLFPDARFIVAARDPVTHIASLMKQHALFSVEEARDPRILAYMRRLGHFEFGLDRRPVNVGDADLVARIRKCWEQGREAEGQALYWRSLYDDILDAVGRSEGLRRATMFVAYDALCGDSVATLRAVYKHCDLEAPDAFVRQQAARLSAPSYYAHSFTEDEKSAILQHTGGTWRRLSEAAARTEAVLNV